VSINLDLSNKVFELLLKKNLEKVFSQVVVSFEERADILY
jgi:ribosome-associated toxin RatA of RatAB toxin-antitoxin module